jgi:hypothetical protein
MVGQVKGLGGQGEVYRVPVDQGAGPEGQAQQQAAHKDGGNYVPLGSSWGWPRMPIPDGMVNGKVPPSGIFHTNRSLMARYVAALGFREVAGQCLELVTVPGLRRQCSQSGTPCTQCPDPAMISPLWKQDYLRRPLPPV